MESRSDRPYRGCRLPRLPGYKVAGTFPFRRSLMTLFDKFYVLCALAACSILVSFWLLVSHRYRYSRVSYDTQPIGGLQTATEFDRRLVVFGDSWSDLNSGEVRVWTDLLCDSFSCHHENLAQTAQFSAGDFVGSVVDNSEVELPEDVREWQVADFKGQVRRWIAAEQEIIQDLSEKEIRKRKNNTITVVSFGLWDLWFLVDKGYDKATKSIDHKLDVIMEQMDLLSETLAGNETKVILTLPVDISFLPAFEPKSVDRQKNAVQIVEYWNNNLREAARKWNNGVIYLFDTNAFMADLVRDRQLFAAGIVQTSGLGKNENPGWENVQDPCVSRGKSWMMYRSERCAKPEKYLFWDEKSVGPSFHRLMATEIFDGINNLWLGQHNVGLGSSPARNGINLV